MTPLDPQRLFDFLEQDPVYQRKLLAKEVIALIRDDEWDDYLYTAVDAARFEVRQLLPDLLTEELTKEIREIVREAFIDAASQFNKRLFEEDPADWWKGGDDDGAWD